MTPPRFASPLAVFLALALDAGVAAAQAPTPAQANVRLGLAARDGQGAPRDLAAAYGHLRCAVAAAARTAADAPEAATDRGAGTRAAEALAGLAVELAPDELALGERLAQDCIATLASLAR